MRRAIPAALSVTLALGALPARADDVRIERDRRELRATWLVRRGVAFESGRPSQELRDLYQPGIGELYVDDGAVRVFRADRRKIITGTLMWSAGRWTPADERFRATALNNVECLGEHGRVADYGRCRSAAGYRVQLGHTWAPARGLHVEGPTVFQRLDADGRALFDPSAAADGTLGALLVHADGRSVDITMPAEAESPHAYLIGPRVLLWSTVTRTGRFYSAEDGTPLGVLTGTLRGERFPRACRDGAGHDYLQLSDTSRRNGNRFARIDGDAVVPLFRLGQDALPFSCLRVGGFVVWQWRRQRLVYFDGQRARSFRLRIPLLSFTHLQVDRVLWLWGNRDIAYVDLSPLWEPSP